MEVEEPGTLIPEGLEPPISECVRFEPVDDPRYAMRSGTYEAAGGTTIRLLAGTDPANAERMDKEVLNPLRFWAVVVPRDAMEPLLIDDEADSEPGTGPAEKRRPEDEFDPIREELDAMDSRLRDQIDVVLQITIEGDSPEDDDRYLLWSIDPEIHDSRGHRYGYGGKNAEISIDLDKRKHGRVRVARQNRNDFHVGPNNRAEKFGAAKGCTVWGAATDGAVWSEYHLSGCSVITSRPWA